MGLFGGFSPSLALENLQICYFYLVISLQRRLAIGHKFWTQDVTPLLFFFLCTRAGEAIRQTYQSMPALLDGESFHSRYVNEHFITCHHH